MSTILASGTGIYQPLVTVPISAAIAIATGHWSELANVVNPILQQAEANQPEGEMMQLDLTGWTIPFIGNVGDRVAAHINTLWDEGKIYDPATGAVPRAWPGATQIASYEPSSDTLVLRWVKGQPFIAWIIGGILVVLGLLYIVHLVSGWFGGGNYRYTLSGNGVAGQSQGMPFIDKVAIGAGAVLIIGFGAWFYSHLKLAEAGAPKTTQEFIFEGR